MPRSRRRRKRVSHPPASPEVSRGGGLAARTSIVSTISTVSRATRRLVADGGTAGERVSSFVVGFREVDRTQVTLVGGKGAQLGELSRIDGIRVPDGFCVTTEAFRRVMADAPAIDGLLDGLSSVGPEDRDAIRTLSAEI